MAFWSYGEEPWGGRIPPAPPPSRPDRIKDSATGRSRHTGFLTVRYIIIQAILSRKSMKKFIVTDEKIFRVYIALYFILSRDVPILKSFSAGRPKIFVCCSGGCSVVAAVAELSWPIVGCKNGRRKQRIAHRTFLFPISKAKQKLSK